MEKKKISILHLGVGVSLVLSVISLIMCIILAKNPFYFHSKDNLFYKWFHEPTNVEIAEGEGDAETKAARRELYEKYGGGPSGIAKMTKQEALDTKQAYDEHTTVRKIQERRQKAEQSASSRY